jgi:hypothetical protein
MVTKVTTANTYSDAELLALFREGVALIAATGQSYQIAGRTFSAASLPAMWDTIERLEARISAASSGPMATNYARLVRG